MASIPNFAFITDRHSRTMVMNGYLAAENLGLSEWFRTCDPGDGGYMFSLDPNVGALSAAVESDGHSGASFGWMCRQLQAYYTDPVAYERAWVARN